MELTFIPISQLSHKAQRVWRQVSANFIPSPAHHFCLALPAKFSAGVGSILDKVAKDIEDTANLYLYLYLRYIFGQPVSYQYLKILNEAKDKISFCKLSGIPIVSIPG